MPDSCRSMYKGGDGLVPIPQANRFGYTAHLRRITTRLPPGRQLHRIAAHDLQSHFCPLNI